MSLGNDAARGKGGPEMSQTALLVTHGSPSDPESQERALAALAEAVNAKLPGWHVASATLASEGRLEDEIARLGHPLIYPFFMAAGWFNGTVLPRRLAPFGLSPMIPFGIEPALPDVAAQRLEKTLNDQGWSARETALVVAAHGSARSNRSADAALGFSELMQARFGFREVRTGFVEQDPWLKPAVADVEQAVCLPFFATNAGHMLEDVPEALAEASFSGVVLPAFIDWPETVDLIAQSLQSAG